MYKFICDTCLQEYNPSYKYPECRYCEASKSVKEQKRRQQIQDLMDDKDNNFEEYTPRLRIEEVLKLLKPKGESK